MLNVMTGMMLGECQQQALRRFCQSAIESAERDHELHVQQVLHTKQQQVEMFMSIFDMLQKSRGPGTGNLTFLAPGQLREG